MFEREPLKFIWENILQLDLQPTQDRFQLVQRDAVLASFDAVKRSVRHANFLREICIGKAATRLSQIMRKLTIKIPLHPAKLAK